MKKYIKYLIVAAILITIFINFKSINIFKSEVNYDPETKAIIHKEKNVTELLKEKYKNDDIIGAIKIPNTDINEVLLQATNNEYYLTHDNYGNQDKYGSVFLDYRCNKDSKKLLIYGHNDYKDKTPFSELENYYNENYYKINQYIDVIIADEKMKYQIFSIYVETEDFTYMNLKINDDEYTKDLIKYKDKSFYNTNVEVSKDDKILILQTCSKQKKYQKYKDKYLLIIAKKIN
ncbi:MAG: class B sortase [Bacilli bacterium]|nr:class B sortase [Bacilli bacterium]